MAENYQDRISKAAELLRQASDMLTEDTNSNLVPNVVAVPASTSIATSISSPVADTVRCARSMMETSFIIKAGIYPWKALLHQFHHR